ncbi:MAG: 50S ribosomal protein L11 methyltransferase [Deltaproteobacteria bacterium]|nr:50S ribosomal protein L11 methyltransferase [Deltaproteobacteria bacterium]
MTTTKKKTKTAPAAELPPWRRLTLDCQMGMAETFAAVLLEEGALGLETEDDETRAVPGRAMLPTGRATIVATFSRVSGLEARVGARLLTITKYIQKAKDVDVAWSDLFAEDWNAIFMAHWRPFRLGRRVWIVPSWEREHFFIDRVGPGRAPLVLHLDPGMAFGTGQHETTQLCTEALERHLDDVGGIQSLLDVGTGTGILALVALRLGALKAKGTDIDPVAVKAALDNARDNGVGASFVANDDMPDAHGPVFDAVIANILAGTLIDLVDHVAGAVAPGGRLWLSGILVEQAAAVIPVYEKRGLKHLATVVKNEWVRIDFKR